MAINFRKLLEDSKQFILASFGSPSTPQAPQTNESTFSVQNLISKAQPFIRAIKGLAPTRSPAEISSPGLFGNMPRSSEPFTQRGTRGTAPQDILLNPGETFIEPGLKKLGVKGALPVVAGLTADILAPGPGEYGKVPKVFAGFKDLTTKVLERLKGKSIVSKQFISDLTSMPELKQAERDLIRNIVGDFDKEVPVQDFANRVKTELLPLKISKPKINYEEQIMP